MDYTWPVFLILLNTVWLFSIVLGIPGTWLMVASAVILEWYLPGAGAMFSLGTLITITVLAGLGELFEFLAGMLGATSAGGTFSGAVGAIVGGLIGGIVGTVMIPVPFLGALIGACLGAAAGTIVMEVRGGMPTEASLRAGWGAGIGRFLGTVIKLVIGVVIWLIIAIAAFVG